MKDRSKFSPPRWATRLLRWYCKPALLEDLEGDLFEYFLRNIKGTGLFRARVIYIFDVLKFFRPYTVRRPEFLNLLIHYIMIGSYLKTSGRTIIRHKLFSAINIVGLAISMSVGLIMIAMLADLAAFDRFHVKYDRIYRVISQYEYNGQKDDDFHATTSLKAAQEIKESFTGVEDVAILRRGSPGDATFGDKTIALSGFWANESFFNVFTFDLIQGNPAAALREPFSVVLTEQSAYKLFGHTDVLGKVIMCGRGESQKQYTVTGVSENVPSFSHFKFDMLASLSTRPVIEEEFDRELKWDNIWDTWAYLVLSQGTQAADVERGLTRLSAVHDKTVERTRIALGLQPLGNIMVGPNLSNAIGQTIGDTVIWILGGLTFIVVLCAALNYTNLSIARAVRRSREVGIRKTIGAQKSHVISQFMTESVIIALLALFLGFGLFLLIKPHFLSIENSIQSLLLLDLTPSRVGLFVLFAVILGLSAGIFPALFFSRINAIQVLKSVSSIPVMRGVTMRKALIVFQFGISIIAITTTLIFHKQYHHYVAYDLGFTTENILNIHLQGSNAGVMRKELEELPEVKGISQSLMVTSIGHFYGTRAKTPEAPLDSAGVNYNVIDENYLLLHEHKLLAGRNFSARPGKSPEHEVIVNEEVLKRFDIGDQQPEKAIGQVLRVNGTDLTIIGVIKDFQYGRANNQSDTKVIMRYDPGQAQYLNVKILSSDWPETYAKIESIWKRIDTVHPLQAKFYDEQIEAGFQGLKASMKMGSFLAFLVITIASIGLLGMVVYSTETRVREVSIRKVFGATELGLIFTLSSGFLVLLVVAAAIGLPVTWWFFQRVLFTQLANHAPLGFEMLTGAFAVTAVALFMITVQTLKVARSNPAQVLKGE